MSKKGKFKLRTASIRHDFRNVNELFAEKEKKDANQTREPTVHSVDYNFSTKTYNVTFTIPVLATSMYEARETITLVLNSTGMNRFVTYMTIEEKGK